MKRQVNLETWNRREHFNFFKQFDDPYYGVCVNVDCTNAYRIAKEKNVSFFLYYLYQAAAAANVIEPFKYRLEEDSVVVYDVIDIGSTIGRDNGTFGFMHLSYRPSFDEFIPEASAEVARVKHTTDLVRTSVNNLIRCSALPWIDFTSLSHASHSLFKDSCPKVSFGKMTENNSKRSMPVSVHVNHALVDGLHVGQYIECFQEKMNG